MIGQTPLIKLNKSIKNYDGQYFAKYEAYNPGHSSKDRISLYIIEKLENTGVLKSGSTIIETTSGNTGFSLAMVSIIKGYDCVLAVTSKSSIDKIDMLKAMGATIYVCPANVSPKDPRSYYQVAKRLNNEIKDSIYINQYFNDLNTEAHYMTTGKEIWEQTNGEITHLVACSGTGGTISGCAKFLKEKNPKIKIIGVDAYGSVLKKFHETKELDLNEIYPYRITGIGKNLIPSTTYFDLIDHFEKVTDEESAHQARKVTSSEGILVGYTTGAAMQALFQLNKKKYFNKTSKVVIIFPDHGSRYMSQIYNENWMENQGFMNLSTNHPQKIEYIDNASEKK
tara:strand:- start:35 stop:1051 length:1017 start_codon:yes stop_codon:yes gene_type:complete